ncbi:MAG: hypothetical protein Q7U02_06755 [Desulfosalsimonadaceae bacterium]|nr:hypothetical protein [Desulfosalsimonadaceae bacterium]
MIDAITTSPMSAVRQEKYFNAFALSFVYGFQKYGRDRKYPYRISTASEFKRLPLYHLKISQSSFLIIFREEADNRPALAA